MGNGTKQVEGQKHPDIQFHFKCTDDARHQPFHFDGTRRPPFVGEVGYSQHPTSLEACARRYYEEGKGEIKTILTIDLEYKARHGKKRAGYASSLFLSRTPPSPTPTPVQNRLEDLASLFAFLRLTPLDDRATFNTHILAPFKVLPVGAKRASPPSSPSP